MDDLIANVEAPRRFNTTLITAFALGALLLAITGIYAVVAISVSLRTREIAIRMALGAQRASIARLVLISGAKMALLGYMFGVLGSVAVSRLVSSLLFDVSATDPDVNYFRLADANKRQQKISRKKEGGELTLSNFFKSRTYMKQVLEAQLPAGMAKAFKAILSAP